ncbi:lecithin retinol acyltransferase family protein [Aquabacterium sp.]|uniref:lecithin retinol acyltransferase family protein n=1 Tax=Aquabacterium sp. TaxID=1872578 RepID=UPI0025BB9450|nr:lecithin retinol acyltransferase family protein [Aquabacterium sp.]
MTFTNPGVICEITRPKLSGVGEHAGVFLPDGRVVHHGQDGPRVDTFEAFAQGRDVRVVRRTDPGKHWQIMGRIQSLLRRPPAYRLLDSNCEHFVSEVLGEKKESRQVNGLAVIALIFVGFRVFA